MRILAVSTWYPYPPDNGAKIRTYHLIRALAQAHDVEVLALEPFDSSGPEPSSRATHQPFEVQRLEVDPFRYVSLPPAVKFLSPVPVATLRSPLVCRAVNARLSARAHDVALAVDWPVAAYVAKARGVTRVLDVHSYLSSQLAERHSHSHGPGVRFRTWASWQKALAFERATYRRFDLCTAVSPRELGYLRHALASTRTQAQVVPNGVDCGTNRPGLAEPIPGTLVYSGSLSYEANLDAMRYFLSDILPLIRERQANVALTITGRTSGADLSGLRLDGGVRFSGHVADIRPVIAAAAACIVPIRQGGGTRLKILEAMALGTPVVSTTKGAEGLTVTDGEDIFLADDPQSFAERTVMLMTDPALRARLALNARRLVETHYDWSSIGRRFVELVEDSHRTCRGGRT